VSLTPKNSTLSVGLSDTSGPPPARVRSRSRAEPPVIVPETRTNARQLVYRHSRALA